MLFQMKIYLIKRVRNWLRIVTEAAGFSNSLDPDDEQLFLLVTQ